MRNCIINNKKGFSFIIAVTLAMIAVVLIAPAMRLITSERRMSDSLAHSTNAFYAAESAVNLALRDLERNTSDEEWDGTGWDRTTNPDRYTLGAGTPVRLYSTNTDSCMIAIRNPVPPDTNPIIEATGYSGEGTEYSPVKERSVITGYNEEEVIPGDDFDKVIKTKGTIERTGAARIEGEVGQNADFDFEDIFDGRTMEEVKNDAYTEVVEDPSNNYEPVQREAEDYIDSIENGRYDFGEEFTDDNSNEEWDDESEVTWFDMSGGGTAMITRNGWTGEGILVVEGDLKITGGTFNGVVYVIGHLSIAGNPKIYGTMFIDGDPGDITKITGSAKINYSEAAIGDGIGRRFSRQALSWREYYPQ